MELHPYLHKVQFYETDGMSIVHHGNYILWMEEARTDFMDQIGWGYERAVEAGIDFALTDISCSYKKTTKFGQTLAIEMKVRKLTPARLVLEARERGMLIDASYGRKTKAVLLMDTDHVILSGIPTETLAARWQDRPEPIQEETEE